MTGTKRITLSIAAILISAVLGSSAAIADQIKIATEGAYFPWNYIDDKGELVGWDVDIANALCAKMEADCEIMAQDWEGIIPGLLAQKYDAIVASMAMTEKRKKRVDFSNKYKDSVSSFFAKSGTITDTSVVGLTGKRIGVQKGSSQHQWLTANGYDGPAEVVLYDTTQGPELDLAAGRVDVAIANVVTTYMKFMEEGKKEGYEFVGDQISGGILGDGSGIAFRKGEDELRERFNMALDGIIKDGTYSEITAKYFPFPVMNGVE